MTSTIKSIVSKNKIRYKEDGFDLDLSYISKNLIAMGFPAEKKLESFYRNHIDDVAKFLNDKHRNRYKIYNLCSEEQRRYDITKFNGPVESKYSFPDHNPPPFVILKPFCDDLHEWLSSAPEKVAAIHCKAGKGRTGVMICTYLVHAGGCDLENGRGRAAIPDADSALEYYGRNRTHDHKGVTIPSQKRYVHYYDELVKRKLEYRLVTLKLSSFTLSSVPNTNGGGYTLICEIFAIPKRKIVTMEVEVKKGCKFVHFVLKEPLFLEGDIKFVFYSKKIKREKLFQFWINTFFVEHGTDSCTIAVEPCRKCTNTNSVSVTVGQSFYSSAPHHSHLSSNWSSEKTKSQEELEKRSGAGNVGIGSVAGLGTVGPNTPSSNVKHSVIDINFFKEIYSRNSKDERFCDCNSDLSREYPSSCTNHLSDVCTTTHSHLTAADLSDALNRSNNPPTSANNDNGSNCSQSNGSSTAVLTGTANGTGLANNNSNSNGNGNGNLKPTNGTNGNGNGTGHGNGSANVGTAIAAPAVVSPPSQAMIVVDSTSSLNQLPFAAPKSSGRPIAQQLTIESRTEKTYELSNKDLFLVIPKHKLDKAYKDKSSKTFPPDFNVVLNFVPTLNSSGSSEGRKLSSFVPTYNTCTDFCVNYSTECISSSETETDDEESDGDSSDAKASAENIEPKHHSPSQCSELARKQACSKKNISGTETTHL